MQQPSMSLFFAWRYLRSKKQANIINIIAWISMVAIGIVTAALVVVLSVFNGFEDLVKQMYGDFYPDLQVSAAKGRHIADSRVVLQKLSSLSDLRAAEPVLLERAILLENEDKAIVWLKGVSESYGTHSGVPAHMVRGTFFVGDSSRPRLVPGFGVEQSLQIVAGQSPNPVTVYLPNPDAGPAADAVSAMVSANAWASGSFAVQQEFDEQYVFTHLSFIQYLTGMGTHVSSHIELYARPGARIATLQKEVAALLGNGFVVKNRYQLNQSLFSAMQTEKLIIYAVAFLILIIAGFNIISSLTMTVIEKQKDIAVLKAMGAGDGSIRNIFLQSGILLAGLGAAAGFMAGVLICLGQQHFHWVKLGGRSFIINYYPVAIRISDLLVVLGIIMGVALLSAWLPSRRATRSYYSLR